MDPIDRAIVTELFLDGRLSYEELATKLGLSTSSVWRRVKLLQEDGVIDRFYVGLHRDFVWPRTVKAIVTVDSSIDEEYVTDLIFSNQLVFSLGSIVNGVCLVELEVLSNDEIDSFEESIRKIDGVISVQSFKGLYPPSDRKCLDSMPDFTISEKKVITHLMENPRLQVGEISNRTGFSARKTKKILEGLTTDNRLTFSLRARTARKGCISFVLKIVVNDYQVSSEVDNWMEQTILEYWWSFAGKDAMFTYFIVQDSTTVRKIAEEVKMHPLVISTQSFIHVPLKKRNKIGERMLRELIDDKIK